MPKQYAYLKHNASKRDPEGSRLKRVKTETAARRKDKRHKTLADHRQRDAVQNGEVEMDIVENEQLGEEVEHLGDESD